MLALQFNRVTLGLNILRFNLYYTNRGPVLCILNVKYCILRASYYGTYYLWSHISDIHDIFVN